MVFHCISHKKKNRKVIYTITESQFIRANYEYSLSLRSLDKPTYETFEHFFFENN